MCETRTVRLRKWLNTVVARAVARTLVRVGTLYARPSRRRSRPSATSSHPTSFDVYTFVADDEQYAAMRLSFEAAGFEPPRARFIRLEDRSRPDGSDPYEIISRIGEQQDRPYVVLVHQDVRVDQGHGIEHLLAALRELDELDPSWVAAGNAGGTPDLRLVRRLRDPHGGSTNDPLPAHVVSLDENFLVFNPRRSPRCSSNLTGFHFYGTDVCLNALEDGGWAYVIAFPVTHLSAGAGVPGYDEARTRFVSAWDSRFWLALVLTPTGLVLLSRSALLRRLLASKRIDEWIRVWGVPPTRSVSGGGSATPSHPR